MGLETPNQPGEPEPSAPPPAGPPETTLEPAAVVKVVRSRKGIKLDPSGVLWMELERGEGVTGALRKVLAGLGGESQS